MSKGIKRRQRLKTRGPSFGACNICGTHGKLSDDHTPPRGCRPGDRVEALGLYDKLSPDEQWLQPRHFQAGISFRTLCQRCNNLLGSQYDPALIHFCTAIRTFARSTVYLPNHVVIKIAPQAVMRSVLGHLAALGVGRYLKGDITEPLRDYLLNTSLPVPPQLRIYYWVYPYLSQVLVRDASYMHLASKAVWSFWLLKFFPLGFMVTIDESEKSLTPECFDRFRATAFESDQEVAFQLRPLQNNYWPERPDDNYLVLFGELAFAGEPLTAVLPV